MVNTSVLPATRCSVMSLKTLPTRTESRIRVKWSSRASTSNGVPSWKVTPSRGVSVHSVKSSLGSKLSSSIPWTSPSASGQVSVS